MGVSLRWTSFAIVVAVAGTGWAVAALKNRVVAGATIAKDDSVPEVELSPTPVPAPRPPVSPRRSRAPRLMDMLPVARPVEGAPAVEEPSGSSVRLEEVLWVAPDRPSGLVHLDQVLNTPFGESLKRCVQRRAAEGRDPSRVTALFEHGRSIGFSGDTLFLQGTPEPLKTALLGVKTMVPHGRDSWLVQEDGRDLGAMVGDDLFVLDAPGRGGYASVIDRLESNTRAGPAFPPQLASHMAYGVLPEKITRRVLRGLPMGEVIGAAVNDATVALDASDDFTVTVTLRGEDSIKLRAAAPLMSAAVRGLIAMPGYKRSGMGKVIKDISVDGGPDGVVITVVADPDEVVAKIPECRS